MTQSLTRRPRPWARAPRLLPPHVRHDAAGLLGTAVPVAAMALVNMAMSVTDTLMAAALGADALAAAAVGSDFYSLVFYFAIGTLGGLAPLYAAAHAEGDAATLCRLRTAGWVIVALVAGPAMAAVWCAPAHLALIGIDPGLLDLGAGYTRAMALTILPMVGAALLRTRLVAIERAGALFRVTLIAVPLNAALNHVLMFGLGGWPGVGLTGAGLSSLLVGCFTFGAFALLAARSGDAGCDRLIDWLTVRAVLRLGVPIGVATLSEVGVYLGATLFVATLSVADAAAHAIAIRTAGVVFAVSLGLMQAATVRIARAGGDPAAHRRVTATALALAAVAGGLLFGSIAIAAGPAAAAAGTGATAVIAPQLLLLVALGESFGPLGATAAGLLRGLQITRAPMGFSLLGHWLVAAPVGAWLALAADLGARGVWIGLILGSAISAFLTLAWLARHARGASAPAAAPILSHSNPS